MSKYKVGDEVVLTRIEDAYGKDHSRGYDLPMVVRIRMDELAGSSYDYGVETLEGDFIAVVFEKFIQPIATEVKKQVITSVKEGSLRIQYMNNTKKNKVSIQRMGTAIGHIKFDEIDSLIGLLTKLKLEV